MVTFTPDNYKTTFVFDTEKKTFKQYKLQSAEIPLLPELVRLEKNNGYNSITGAENLLRIRNATNWTKCTLTGLRPTGTPNFYYADLPIKGKKSFCVVYLPEDGQSIEVRITPQFYPKPDLTKTLKQIINNF